MKLLWEILKTKLEGAFVQADKKGIRYYLFKGLEEGKISLTKCYIFSRKIIDLNEFDPELIIELYEAGILNDNEVHEIIDNAIKEGKIEQKSLEKDLGYAYIKKCGNIYLVYDYEGNFTGILKNWE